MQLQFLDTPCPRGATLSQSVLQRAKSALFDDHMNLDAQNGTRSLNKTRPYLDMLSVILISKRQGNLEDLFNFYTPILGKTVLSSISTEDQLIVLRHFAEALHACKSNPPSVIRLLNLTPFFFEVRTTSLLQPCTLNIYMFVFEVSFQSKSHSSHSSKSMCAFASGTFARKYSIIFFLLFPRLISYRWRITVG